MRSYPTLTQHRNSQQFMSTAILSFIVWIGHLILPSTLGNFNPNNEFTDLELKSDHLSSKAEISFELNGKKIISSDYSCSYSTEGIPVFNLTVFHDRDQNPQNPPSLAFNIYNLRSADEKLYSQKDKKPWTTEEPVYGLDYTLPGKNMPGINEDETSYVDTYEGATSSITIQEFDLNNKTASGTFSGILVNAKGDSVSITNGVFKNVSITVH